MCVCVNEAVFHSIQIRIKRNRGEEGRRSRRLCWLPISFFFHITIMHKRPGRVFFSWSIESNIEERNENEMKKKRKITIHIKKREMKGVDRFWIHDISRGNIIRINYRLQPNLLY
jgi:hypothetical protein